MSNKINAMDIINRSSLNLPIWCTCSRCNADFCVGHGLDKCKHCRNVLEQRQTFAASDNLKSIHFLFECGLLAAVTLPIRNNILVLVVFKRRTYRKQFCSKNIVPAFHSTFKQLAIRAIDPVQRCLSFSRSPLLPTQRLTK